MMLKAVLTAFLILPVLAKASSFYQVVNRLDSNSDQKTVAEFLNQLEGRLPIKLKAEFPNGISVKFEPLEKSHGRASRGMIILNSKLLPIILSGEQASKPSLDPEGHVRTHKTEFREAQATVLHETAHLYDFKNIRTDSEKAYIQQCQLMAQDKDLPKAEGCEVYQSTSTTVSTDPYYLEIAGWPLATQGENFREKKNFFSKRSADPYEFKNSIEHFAVNFEYYLLDPEFSCRKPTLASFLEAHFQHRPFPRSCDSWLYVDPSVSQANQVIRSLPFERVYQIHYLHAARGQEMMSRWGHSMYRVVICSPERKTVGPDCMKDEFYHVVLSFRAFINTYGIDSWKGLTGQYPSRLFIVPLEEVKQSYNVDEFRDVQSYPLNLTRSEMKSFLKRSLETHWNYENSYYFLTNNCASESLNLLKSSVLRPELLDKKVIKPTELLDLFFRLKLIDQSSYPKDPREAFNNGYLFVNHSDRFIKALSELTGKSESVKSITAHLESDFQSRKRIYENSGETTLKKLAAQVILESAALDRSKTKARALIFAEALKSQKAGQSSSFIDDLKISLDKSIELFNTFSAPYEFLNSDTYGIPLLPELTSTQAHLEKLWQENRQITKQRSEKINNQISENQAAEIQAAEKNLKETQEKMVALSLRAGFTKN